ncbi:3-hydroxyanthranilic acid dioxygenase [Dimargaris verticillata]|uniref:3-hydroxyanthranilate 3,4-dioxygenase n=1 Tax=Dimargaris verticillata TaxID=2761393 RepID=A0A9W8E6X8_9FUNG|nr:3-hydroxyanthranilic acid dioxygenase [Dimargaris verticillata]
MPLPQPINFPRWLESNQHRLAPPIGNAILQEGQLLIMIVGGPNQRTDYHVNETEEWFYQYKGDMVLKVVDSEHQFQDIAVKEGDMFLLPANTPHSPVRFADTIGIVVETKRRPDQIDTLRWYCEQCHETVYEESFFCQDLGKDLKPIVERYAGNESLRTCKQCQHTNPAK